MFNRLTPGLITLGGFLMVGMALLSDSGSSLIAGISVGRGGGSSGNGGKNDPAKTAIWNGFMTASTAQELEYSTANAESVGFDVSVTQS